jgi:lipid II:glycine glycyltransferase (peptidoglycan interpeptide bridge formation enzyme)
LSDFFKNLSENFHSVKLQLDKGRAEFERLSKLSEENRAKNENSRSELVQVFNEYSLFAFIL